MYKEYKLTLPLQGRLHGPRSYIFSPHLRVDGGSGLRVRRMGSVGNILHCDAQIGGGPNWAKNAKKSGI